MEVQSFMPALNLENRTQPTKKLRDMEIIKHLLIDFWKLYKFIFFS